MLKKIFVCQLIIIHVNEDRIQQDKTVFKISYKFLGIKFIRFLMQLHFVCDQLIICLN